MTDILNLITELIMERHLLELQVETLLSHNNHLEDLNNGLTNALGELEANNSAALDEYRAEVRTLNNALLDMQHFAHQNDDLMDELGEMRHSLNEMTADRNHYRDLFSMLGESLRKREPGTPVTPNPGSYWDRVTRPFRRS